jgi:P pilus assembly chaperone PapD
MKRFKSIAVAACAILMAAAYIMPVPQVSAASASMSIAPKKNYVIEPGKSVKDKLTIRNLDNNQELNLTLRVVDFTFTDDGGTPKLFLAEDAPQTTWSLKPFMTVPKTVTIPPKGTKTLDMSVSIPAWNF